MVTVEREVCRNSINKGFLLLSLVWFPFLSLSLSLSVLFRLLVHVCLFFRRWRWRGRDMNVRDWNWKGNFKNHSALCCCSSLIHDFWLLSFSLSLSLHWALSEELSYLNSPHSIFWYRCYYLCLSTLLHWPPPSNYLTVRVELKDTNCWISYSMIRLLLKATPPWWVDLEFPFMGRPSPKCFSRVRRGFVVAIVKNLSLAF